MEDRRASISDRDRKFLENNKDKFGLGETAAKDVYALTVALGMESPKEMTKKNTSWIRAATIDMNTRAVIATARLGAEDITDENINQFAEYNACISFADQCSYAGFEKLAKMLADATDAKGNYDDNIFVSELMHELDRLYEKNVKPEEDLQIC